MISDYTNFPGNLLHTTKYISSWDMLSLFSRLVVSNDTRLLTMHCHYAEWQVQLSYCECYNAVCVYIQVCCVFNVYFCALVYMLECVCVYKCVVF